MTADKNALTRGIYFGVLHAMWEIIDVYLDLQRIFLAEYYYCWCCKNICNPSTRWSDKIWLRWLSLQRRHTTDAVQWKLMQNTHTLLWFLFFFLYCKSGYCPALNKTSSQNIAEDIKLSKRLLLFFGSMNSFEYMYSDGRLYKISIWWVDESLDNHNVFTGKLAQHSRTSRRAHTRTQTFKLHIKRNFWKKTSQNCKRPRLMAKLELNSINLI